ncbi:hypothetical protein ACHAW5_009709 [Stephanodiscus triporus]|uniref:Uncharacterized protein n=1 Tax=Stephanodiscus triporus TaxID=2934178 RepID=A0ABD3MTN8_9STRA
MRILKCMDMLGRAVHPSECAFRSIAPVTKGPIRGYKIPIKQQLPETLAEITKLYSDHVDKKFNAVIASLETGRSRFDSPSGHVFGFSPEELVQNGLGHSVLGIDRTTFTDTMKIAYGRNSDCHDLDDSCVDLDPEKENALRSQIWAQHVNDLPMTKSIYLMHDPDDLTKIYRVKSFRSSATTSFASEITRSFRPQLRTPKSDSRGMLRARDINANNFGKRSAKPLFDAGKVVCHSRSLSSPLAKFLDFDHDNNGMGQNQIPGKIR